MNTMSSGILFTICAVLIAHCTACGSTDTSISKTPDYYPEDRLLYSAPAKSNSRHKLFSSTRDTSNANSELQKGDAYTVILHAVQMPSIRYDSSVSGDILIVLDAEDGRGNNFKNLAVYYQEGAQPNSCLNLHDLSIFTCPGFDPNSPPYFRIQVIDVDSQDNKLLSGILGEVRQVSDVIGEAFANPFSPIISLGLKIGELAAQMNKDDTIMDFSFQLYEVRLQNKLVAANELRSGLWVAVGLSPNLTDGNGHISKERPRAGSPASQSSQIVNALREGTLHWDDTNRRLVVVEEAGDDPVAVDAPVLVFEIVKGAQYAIPSAAKRTLGELQQVLDSNTDLRLSQIDSIGDSLRSALLMDQLNSSLQSYAANDKLTLLRTNLSVLAGKSEESRLPSDSDQYFMRTVRGFADGLKMDLLKDGLYRREIGVVLALQLGKDSTTVETLVRDAKLAEFLKLVFNENMQRLSDEGEAFLASYRRRDELFRNLLLAEQLPVLARNSSDAVRLGKAIDQFMSECPSLNKSEASLELMKQVFYRMRVATGDLK